MTMDEERFKQLLRKLDSATMLSLIFFIVLIVLVVFLLIFVWFLIYDRYKSQQQQQQQQQHQVEATGVVDSFAIRRSARARRGAFYPKSKSSTITTATTAPSEGIAHRDLTYSSHRYMLPVSVYNVENESTSQYNRKYIYNPSNLGRQQTQNSAGAVVVKSHSEPLPNQYQAIEATTTMFRKKNAFGFVRRSKSWDLNNNSYSISSSVNGCKTFQQESSSSASKHTAPLIPSGIRSRLIPVNQTMSDASSQVRTSTPSGGSAAQSGNQMAVNSQAQTTDDDVFTN